MKKIILITSTLFIGGFVNAQKITKIENGGRLTICDIGSNNYTTNCNTVVSSRVTGASIGKNKVAVLYNTGQLTVYNLDRNNYLSSGNTLVSSGVLGVQMNNDEKIISASSSYQCSNYNSYYRWTWIENWKVYK